jgi:hypothetical protein
MESLSNRVTGNTQPSITALFKQVNIADHEQQLDNLVGPDSDLSKVLGLPPEAQ